MPDIDFAFLADAAETVPGQKFHVLGGGIARIGGRRFPLRHPHLALVIGLQVTAPETEREHEIRFVLLDPDGGEVAGATGSLVARSQRDGRDATLTFSIDLWNLTFPAPGDYSFRILVNGSERKRLPLLLARAAGAAPSSDAGHRPRRMPDGDRGPSPGRRATSCRPSMTSRWSPRGTPIGCWPRPGSAAPFAGSAYLEPLPDRLRDEELRGATRRGGAGARGVRPEGLDPGRPAVGPDRAVPGIDRPPAARDQPRASGPATEAVRAQLVRAEGLEQERGGDRRVVAQASASGARGSTRRSRAGVPPQRPTGSSASATARPLGKRPSSMPTTATWSNSAPLVEWAVARLRRASSRRSSASRDRIASIAVDERGQVGVGRRPGQQGRGKIPVRARSRAP